MALKAVAPKIVKPSKPKILIFGAGGKGKTWGSLEFPSVYYIDTEAGADKEHYQDKLARAGGVYMGIEQGSRDFKTVVEEVRSLATIRHNYKTLVIDSFSKLYNVIREDAERKGGSEFGRDKKEANKPSRQLITAMDLLDMNAILVCHEIDKWESIAGKRESTGKTFDGFDKLEYEMHLTLQIVRRAGPTKALIIKSRFEQFVEGTDFDWSYNAFAEKYGREIMETPAEPVVLASDEQIAELNELIAVIKVEAATLDQWKTKANCEEWSEMNSDQIGKCIAFLKGKLPK